MTAAFRDVGEVPATIDWRGALVRASDAHGRVLMQLRDDFADVAGPGLWSLFGGGVEPGETLETAACREFAEETGIELSPDTLRPLARTHATAKPNGVLFVFGTDRIVHPAEIRLGEGAGFGLLSAAQIDAFPMIPQIRAALQALRGEQ